MPFNAEVFFYRDDKGRLKKTKSGHYRFDLRLSRQENGRPYATIIGFRFNYDQKKIINPTLTTPRGTVVVAEIAPGEHDDLAEWLHTKIKQELEELANSA